MPFFSPVRLSRVGAGPVLLALLALVASLLAAAGPAAAVPTGPAELISTNADGDDSGDDQSTGPPSISDDGRYVAFTSRATDLVDGFVDGNGANFGDVYLRDTAMGTTTLVSHAAGSPLTSAAGGSSGNPRVSADGRYVVYDTFATNLVAGVTDTNNERDVYLYSVANGTTTLVSHAHDDTAQTCDQGQSLGADIANDGSVVAYQSACDDLIDNMQASGDSQVFRWDRAADTTELVSRPNAINPNNVVPGNGSSQNADLSGDGQFVVYTTAATNIGAGGDANGTSDIGYYRIDGVNGGNLPALSTYLSLNNALSGTGNGFASRATISDDGRWVSYETEATDIGGGTDGNGGLDVILVEVPPGQVPTWTRISSDAGGDAGNNQSFKAVVAGSGSYVAFLTLATDLVTTGPVKATGASWDVVRYDVGSGDILLASPNAAGTDGGNDDSGAPGLAVGLGIASNGDVIYSSEATDLVNPAIVDVQQIWAFDGSDVTLLSAVPDGSAPGGASSRQPVIASSGDWAAWATTATDLTETPDTNGESDIVAIVPEQALGQLAIDDVEMAEGTGGETTFAFTITLDTMAPSDVTVDWATADTGMGEGHATGGGSAIEGVDYLTASGTATITSGSTTATVEVTVYGDTITEPDETFAVVLSNPVGAMIAADGDTGIGTILDGAAIDVADLRDGVNDTLRVIVEGGAANNENAEVALRFSRSTFPDASESTFAQDGPRRALLATDAGFADALASGALQGNTVADGRPLLLTATDELYPEVVAELERLDVTEVGILGGIAAIDQSVEDELVAAGYTVVRYAGPSRLETAIEAARIEYPSATTGILARAFPAAGGDDTQAFADSLAAGAWAADEGWPLLFTQTEVLSTSTSTYLVQSTIETLYVVGGEAAINETVLDAVRALGIEVIRVAGGTRFDTALEIAGQRGYTDERDAERVMVLDGTAPDAWAAGFAGAAHSAIHGAPVVLGVEDQIVPQTAAFLDPPSSFAVDVDDVDGYVLVCGIAPERCTESRSLLGLPDLADVVEPEGSYPQGGTVPFELSGPYSASGYETLLDCDGEQALVTGGAVSGSTTISVDVPADHPTGTCLVKVKLVYANGSEQLAVADVEVAEAP
ncbi:cell wall-binding repeat-containing protein [Euzebya pacifica]|uniref:cell wall-binding repeat-containing protein n=1 Tax=Euzebya pacifica TaxID=1608957 RepID=UPI0030FB66A4